MANWRNLGNTTREAWRKWHEAHDSPLAAVADATYDAAYPHTLRCIGMLWVES
jgi:hypothetical protein